MKLTKRNKKEEKEETYLSYFRVTMSTVEHVIDSARGPFGALCTGPFDETTTAEGTSSPAATGSAAPTAPIVFFIHGAGMSGHCFTPCAGLLLQGDASGGDQYYPVRSCALDLAGHGKTASLNGNGNTTTNEVDLSAEALTEDCVAAIDAAMSTIYGRTHRLYLVGHSLGGALVARVAHHALIAPRLAGAVVVDVVEGTAKSALVELQNAYSS